MWWVHAMAHQWSKNASSATAVTAGRGSRPAVIEKLLWKLLALKQSWTITGVLRNAMPKYCVLKLINNINNTQILQCLFSGEYSTYRSHTPSSETTVNVFNVPIVRSCSIGAMKSTTSCQSILCFVFVLVSRIGVVATDRWKYLDSLSIDQIAY